MALEIKTSSLQQHRQTFAHIARRLGEDRPASRYEEATFDIQPQENFYYRSTWDSRFEIYDKSRTAIVMSDWYALTDPRQLYYGTYTIGRARQIETVERNFEFVERRGLLLDMDADRREIVQLYLLPLRHAEWGANMNACSIADVGYGTAITQAAIFAATDRLGISQIIGRIGLLLGGAEALTRAKETWVASEAWQPMRRLVEDSLVIDDWFEMLVAQFFVLDGLIYPIFFEAFDADNQRAGSGLSMICEFMVDWQKDSRRWVDSVISRAAKESPENRQVLADWTSKWEQRTAEALAPLVEAVLGDDAAATIAEYRAGLSDRAVKAGISVAGDPA